MHYPHFCVRMWVVFCFVLVEEIMKSKRIIKYMLLAVVILLTYSFTETRLSNLSDGVFAEELEPGLYDGETFTDWDTLVENRTITIYKDDIDGVTSEISGHLVIPEGITRILISVSAKNLNLSRLTVPKSLEVINETIIKEMKNLEAVDVDEENEYYCSKDGVLFSKDMKKLILYPRSKKDLSYEIPEGVTSLASTAISENSFVKLVKIPKGVKTINNGNFLRCNYLSDIFISSTVTYINGPFCGYAESLKGITIDPENPSFKVEDGVLYTKDMKSLITYPAGKLNVEFTIPDEVITLNFGCFEGCKNLLKVKLGKKINQLENYAFAGCSELTEMVFPESVKLINNYAFDSCDKLESITFEGETKISDRAFYNRGSKEDVFLPTIKTIVVPDELKDSDTYSEILTLVANNSSEEPEDDSKDEPKEKKEDKKEDKKEETKEETKEESKEEKKEEATAESHKVEEPRTAVPLNVQPEIAAPIAVAQPTVEVTDNPTSFSIKNKKSYKASKKIKIKDEDGLSKIKLNGKTIKVKSGKKSISFKISKYKKFLKKKGKWNKLVITDSNGNKTTIKFKVK